MDTYTVSTGNNLIELYFERPEGKIVDYLVISEKENDDLTKEHIKELLDEQIFFRNYTQREKIGKLCPLGMAKICELENPPACCYTYKIKDIMIYEKNVDGIKNYTEKMNFEMQGTKLKQNDLPDQVRIAEVDVYNKVMRRSERYILMLQTFEVENMQINEQPGTYVQTNYTFLLVKPRELVMDKVEAINDEVRTQIYQGFIGPWIVGVIVIMIIISKIM